MSSSSQSTEEYDTRYLLPQGVGNSEDVEQYRLGGLHPVHLQDRYKDGRYRIVHKLGAGGFSTVWLARDESENKWVALKIVDAEHSLSVARKSDLSRAALAASHSGLVATQQEQFFVTGPNGRHLCLILPVFGPATAELSYGLICRLTLRLARNLAYQATQAVADLHSTGLCHGDVTTGNLLLTTSDLDAYDEEGIYQLFGQPVTGVLETESGDKPGPEAPRYVVRSIDFLSAAENIIRPEIKLVDFDQCFPLSSPPQHMIGTPLSFTAPEVAVGRPASPASDVWALGCCILRLRSGQDPFSAPFEVASPLDLISYIIRTLGKPLPPEWQQSLFWDRQGQPTSDSSKGIQYDLDWRGRAQSLRGIVDSIWDKPTNCLVQTGILRPEGMWSERDHRAFPSCFSHMVWNPRSVKVDNTYVRSYGSGWEDLLEVLPKISEREADLLYNLLSKIFVYGPTERITAQEMLDHPWFKFSAEDRAQD